MESDNEKVAEIGVEVRRVAHNVSCADEKTLKSWRPAAYLAKLADRIVAAHNREIESYKRLLMTSQCALESEIVKNQNHRREIAELRECVRQAYTDVCLKCVRNGRNIVCSRDRECENVKRWRKAMEGAK